MDGKCITNSGSGSGSASGCKSKPKSEGILREVFFRDGVDGVDGVDGYMTGKYL